MGLAGAWPAVPDADESLEVINRAKRKEHLHHVTARSALRVDARGLPSASRSQSTLPSRLSMQFVFLLEQVVNGLVLGGYYLLIALGLSLIFSVGGMVNLAHGAFYALGAYVSVEITNYLGFGPAVVLSPVAVALLGILFERFLLRRFYAADPILSLLVTFGLAMIAEQLIRIIWGASPLSVRHARQSSRARSSSATSCSLAIGCCFWPWSSVCC